MFTVFAYVQSWSLVYVQCWDNVIFGLLLYYKCWDAIIFTTIGCLDVDNICILNHYHIIMCDYSRYWSIGMWGLWDIGEREWLQYSNIELLSYWTSGHLQYWNVGMLGDSNIGICECWWWCIFGSSNIGIRGLLQFWQCGDIGIFAIPGYWDICIYTILVYWNIIDMQTSWSLQTWNIANIEILVHSQC